MATRIQPKIPLAKFLFTRLRQVGVDHVFGVPGDFTLKSLDHIKAAGSKFVGNCNELNAGYAADGYARSKGFAALSTTYGVGELSAINAVAGSYAEHVPLVHIVGLPQRSAVRTGAIVHHTLGDGRTRVFRDMHEKVTVAQAYLDDPATATKQIDQAIGAALSNSRPAYIELPNDMVDQEVDSESLDTPIPVLDRAYKDIERVSKVLAELLQNAQHPLLLIDRGMGMDQFRDELNDFVRTTGLPTLTMPSGAGMIDHSIPNYYGVHSGPVGQVNSMPYVNSSDLVLAFGPMFSDTQTLGFAVVPDRRKTVTLGKHEIQVFDQDTRYKTDFRKVLHRLTAQLSQTNLSKPDTTSLSTPDFRNFQLSSSPSTTLDTLITQSAFYQRLSTYLRPHDTILLANATPILGGRDLVLPSPTCRVIVSGLWFSIGHMLPAALGAALAQHKSGVQKGRVVLLEGDGSFQVTAQELSTIVRLRLNVTIFLINNSGYAYERLIHRPDEDYHDIAPWDYLALPKAMGGDDAVRKAREDGEDYSIETVRLETWRDLETLLVAEEFDNGDGGRGRRGLKLVDVRVGRTDIPDTFRKVFESAGDDLG